MILRFRTKIFLSIVVILIIGMVPVYLASVPLIQKRINEYIDNEINEGSNKLEKFQEQLNQTLVQYFQELLFAEKSDLSAAISCVRHRR